MRPLDLRWFPVPRLALAGLAVFAGLAGLGCKDPPLPGPDAGQVNFAEFLQNLDGGVDPGTEVPIPKDVPPVDQCKEVWRFQLPEGGAAQNPVVHKDGTITAVSAVALQHVTPTGQEVCPTPFTLTGELFGSPALSTEGTAYLGTQSGKLVAVDKKCQAKWKQTVVVSAGHAIREAPVVEGNALYVLDDVPVLRRIRDDGTQALVPFDWEFKVKDSAMSGANVVHSGGGEPWVAFPSRTQVSAVRTSGAKHWQLDVTNPAHVPDAAAGREVTSTLALTRDREVLFIVGTRIGDRFNDNRLHRVLPEPVAGSAASKSSYPKALDLPTDHVMSIVVAGDESIFLGTQGHGVVKLDAQGNQLWYFVGDQVSLHVRTVPAVGDDGAVYFTAEPQTFYGVNSDGDPIFRTTPQGSELLGTSPNFGQNGTLYVQLGVSLFAYTCPSHGLAVASWPRYQRNPRGAGRLDESL